MLPLWSRVAAGCQSLNHLNNWKTNKSLGRLLMMASSSVYSTSGYLETTSNGCRYFGGSADSSVNKKEADKFAKMSQSWWDMSGPCKPLHDLNKVRCEFIRGILRQDTQNDGDEGSGRRVLDVGCGGGILSESLIMMPGVGHVTGIDVHEQGVEVAREHAQSNNSSLDGRGSLIEYRVEAIEDLIKHEPESYDVVVASEVIEHVDSIEFFCSCLIQATKPGGKIIISTLNRTGLSYLLAIVGAEYVLRMVPEGTHEWSRFVTPEELLYMMCYSQSESVTVSLDMMSGMSYQPLTGEWTLSRDTDMNYIASFKKQD
jgi:ubiquinone biosynthesis O-methyltransferase